MTDDEKRRTELLKLGVSRVGSALVGVARSGYAPTPEQLLDRVLAALADLRAATILLQAETTGLRFENVAIMQRLDQVEAEQTATRQKAGHSRHTQAQAARLLLVKQINRARAQLKRRHDRVTIPQAIRAYYSRSRRWAGLPKADQDRKVTTAIRQYYRGLEDAKKTSRS